MIEDLSRTPPHIMPGAGDAPTTPPEVAEALGEFLGLQARDAEADRETVLYASEIEQLEAEEIRTSAEALRAGRPAPKPTAPKKRQELEQRERQVAVLRIAAEDSFRELERAVVMLREPWVLDFPSSRAPKPARVGTPALRRPNGDAYRPGELVDALRVYAAGGAKSAAIA